MAGVAVSKLRQEVRQKLDGMETRQMSRDAARRFQAMAQRVYRARREGLMGTQVAAECCLRLLGVPWDSEVYYGVTMIYTHAGITLCFTPDGALSWHAGPRITSTPDGDQLELFAA